MIWHNFWLIGGQQQKIKSLEVLCGIALKNIRSSFQLDNFLICNSYFLFLSFPRSQEEWCMCKYSRKIHSFMYVFPCCQIAQTRDIIRPSSTIQWNTSSGSPSNYGTKNIKLCHNFRELVSENVANLKIIF